MKKTAILMVGVLLLTFGGEAVARPGGPMGERIGPPAFLRGLIRPETVMRNQRAVNLSDAQREQLQAKLEQRFGSKVELNFSEDSQLMGSMVITAGNWVMDGSIQSKIERLNEVLTT